MSVKKGNWWWRRISREVEKLKAKARVGRAKGEGGKSDC